jgi:L-lysine exporter family protein LysE/ArgO
MLIAMVHGFILAFGLIFPLGVQNVFIFNQGVTQPRLTRALPVIITASLCDTFLILIAVMGVSVIVFGVPLIKISLLIVGILFLIYMGYVTWKSELGNDFSVEKALSPKNQIIFQHPFLY